jgi:50S ribosomal protein L16 3-hydroxylase
MYRDARQGAVEGCAAIPIELQAFAGQALNRVLEDRTAVQRVLGEYLTEPKASVCFAAGNTRGPIGTLKLDRCTRMMYDTRHIFVNGESYLAAGRDARFLHSLANERTLSADVVQRFSRNAKAWLSEWISAGWMHGE